MIEFIITFFASIIIAPIVICVAKKLKFGQNILGYVSEHSYKQGTPTMGGLIFILPTVLISLFFLKSDITAGLICLTVFIGYGLVGFLDDFIKIKFKQNLGLRAYQKIIFQILIALFVSVYIYRNQLFLNAIYLPFSNIKIDLGLFIIPFVIILFLATTNSVNLTDGLDGLAGSVSLIVFIAITIVNSLYINSSVALNQEYLTQLQNLNSISMCLSGGLLAFLVFNFYPAKIFMGDTGSLAIGGLLAIVCALNGLSLYILVFGAMFVLSAISVIIQVVFFKCTKKRVFLMAPFHHHLQHKGMHETKIVFIYIVITLMLTLIGIALLRGIL